MKTPLVIGLGNDFRRDDGAGRIAARRVRELVGDAVRVIEESGKGAALMDAWGGAELVVRIDAVHSGAKPGDVHHLDAQAQSIPVNFFTTQRTPSGHAKQPPGARRPPALFVN